MDTIMQTDTGYLFTPDDPFADVITVQKIEDALVCDCRSGELGQCAHIEAIDDYRLSQGEVGIPSQDRVDLLLMKVARLEERMVRNDKAATAEIEHIEAWLERENGKLAKRIRYIMYWSRLFLEESGMKTAVLPNGTLKLRLQQEKLDITDEEAVINDGRFVRMIPEMKVPDKKAIRSHIKETGEVPNGVEWVAQEPKFSWECDGPEVDYE